VAAFLGWYVAWGGFASLLSDALVAMTCVVSHSTMEQFKRLPESLSRFLFGHLRALLASL
jgi:hypothetical protein